MERVESESANSEGADPERDDAKRADSERADLLAGKDLPPHGEQYPSLQTLSISPSLQLPAGLAGQPVTTSGGCDSSGSSAGVARGCK
jgi:hypothetical protein